MAPPIRKKRRVRRRPIIVSFLIILLAGSYCAVAISRPFAELSPNKSSSSLSITTPAAQLPWPAYGQGALGLAIGEIIASNGEQTKVPIASAAKIVTALVILEKHPLAPGASGPIITMSEADAASYRRYVSIQGSVTPVSAGQKISQRDMLEALMLPSANNIADSLAVWSFGSVKNYLTYANDYLQKRGLKDTVMAGDASGYLPDSMSTTRDLVKLGALAMNNQALAEIVKQKTAVVSGVGTVKNYNSLLGANGIVGIKTGNNDQNGGVFVGAAEYAIGGKKVVLISALSGAPTLSTVLRDSRSLLVTASSTFADTTIVKKDAVLGTYRQPNGQTVQAVASAELNAVLLRGTTVKAATQIDSIGYSAKAGQKVGEITLPATDIAPAKSVPIVLKQSPVKPDLWYRLTHPR